MTASLTRILLATDGSEEAALAGRVAADLSNRTAANLHVVHVWTDVPPPAYYGPSLENYSRLARDEAMRLLRTQAWNARVTGGRVLGHTPEKASRQRQSSPSPRTRTPTSWSSAVAGWGG